MTMPKAYDPQGGYQFQIFCRNLQYSREWEHCDYAKTFDEKKFLIGEYKVSYGAGWEFKSEMLPMRFWPKRRRFTAGGWVMAALLLCLLLPQQATAKITCITKLTGQSVCTDTDTSQTFERVDKLTGDSEWVVTWPGRERDRHPHSDREDRHHEQK